MKRNNEKMVPRLRLENESEKDYKSYLRNFFYEQNPPRPDTRYQFAHDNSLIDSSEYNNDDKLFIAESNTIKNIAKNSCVIVGRCGGYVLKEKKNVIKIFLYSDEKNRINRVVKYYNIPRSKAKKEIDRINKAREKHYSYYTGTSIYDPSNYDLMINVDSDGVDKTVDYIVDYILKKYDN